MGAPDPIDLYRRASSRAIEVADAVGADQLRQPTPCDAWTVQDLLDHLVGGTVYLRTSAGEPVEPPERSTAEDLRSGVASCLQLLGQPGVLDRTCTSPLGFEWTVGAAVAGTFMDVLIHTWDLAIATGQDPTLDPELVDACIDMFLPDMPEHGRAAGLIGPPVEIGPDASPVELLLGAMGRRA